MDDRTRATLADLALAGLTFSGAAVLLVGAASLPPPRFEPLGSAALPRILGSILFLFAAIIAITAIRRASNGKPAPTAKATVPKADPKRGALVLAALIIYAFMLDVLRVPFLVATPLFVTATGLSIGARSWRNLAAFAVLGLILAGGISVVLERFLYVRIG
ncbi:tripartite tricarboxylate transporter TctB family protein [Fluviibacterium sp. DFM31]|uniref:Tripartite tricarboxylate transporter TctB family protein n=1 Tax=Meridianimarinicoccus marinus TaxID=3231483 RepID=A0ABV3L6T6_9RHOB